MNRVELKEWSKEKIVGNKAEIWKGILLVLIISMACGIFMGLFNEESISGSLVTLVINIALIPMEIGLIDFFIKFVKTGELNKDVIFDHYSEIWKLVGTIFIMGILITVGTIFFIIPGIYLAFSYSLVPYLLVERKDLSIMETLELSRHMMVGHKIDFFVLSLSFIGWAILVPFTLGILLIWLYPYMQTAITKFYLDVIDSYEG